MTDNREIALSKMKSGESGIVIQIQGGKGIINRLSALGIRVGQRITKISSMLLRGPVTIQVGSSQVAIGYGMANKVIVRVS